MSNYSQYLTRCNQCGASTSQAYARQHSGHCKACETGAPANDRPSRNQRIIEHGYDAYAREEGHYDTGDR